MVAIIHERLEKYSLQTSEDEENALKEILQEIILCALADAGFFADALFQGGTALRVFYNLGRFSEDLDFILKKPDPKFKWQPFILAIENTCKQYGIEPEVLDKSKMGTSIQKMLLKDNSMVKILNLSFHRHAEHKFRIKLEVDTNPPLGSTSEIKFLDFPVASEIELQDLPSNFAGKSHAVLCRKYLKGRDWYDFLWYISKEIIPNFIFLSNAIHQQGPWAEQNITVTPQWYCAALEEKIQKIDWQQAANDVAPFLSSVDRNALKLWSQPFFQDKIQKLKMMTFEET